MQVVERPHSEGQSCFPASPAVSNGGKHSAQAQPKLPCQGKKSHGQDSRTELWKGAGTTATTTTSPHQLLLGQSTQHLFFVVCSSSKDRVKLW